MNILKILLFALPYYLALSLYASSYLTKSFNSITDALARFLDWIYELVEEN